MLLIGLTGRSGAGKGYVSALFAELGKIPAIDCDAVSRAVCQPGMPCTLELAETFGADILEEDGTLRRRALAARVFGDAQLIASLNRVTHKHILAALDVEIAAYAEKGERALILDAPTLFESGLAARCDCIISVLADDETCMRRVSLRDTISETEAKKRLAAQHGADFYLENSDYIVYNKDSDDAVAQVQIILSALFRDI